MSSVQTQTHCCDCASRDRDGELWHALLHVAGEVIAMEPRASDGDAFARVQAVASETLLSIFDRVGKRLRPDLPSLDGIVR